MILSFSHTYSVIILEYDLKLFNLKKKSRGAVWLPNLKPLEIFWNSKIRRIYIQDQLIDENKIIIINI